MKQLRERILAVVTENSIAVVWLGAMLQTVLQYFFFYVGLAHTSGVKASVIEAVNVFVAVIVSVGIYVCSANGRQKKQTLLTAT